MRRWRRALPPGAQNLSPHHSGLCLCRHVAWLLLALCFWCQPAYTRPLATTPYECVAAMQEAVDAGSADDFLTLVNIDAILNDALATLLARAQDTESASGIQPLLALLFSQMAGQKGEAARRLLLEEARAFVLNGVASGAFAGKKLADAQQRGLLAPLFANASLGRKQVVSIGDAARTADGWLMPFSVRDFGNGEDYAVVGKFSVTDGECRLEAVENLDQLFLQIQRENQE